MRRWLSASTAAAGEVAGGPDLWLPGALAWTVSVGWIALVAGVGRPPGAAELTFFGARAATSGLWPWNLVVGLLLIGLALVVGFALATLAEAALIRRRPPRVGGAWRGFAIAVTCALPVAAAALAVAVALPGVAQAEFNAPDADPGPLLRTILRLAPLLGAVLVAAAAGSAVHAVALRSALGGRPAGQALRQAPGRLAAVGAPAVVHALALSILRIAFVLLAAVLLRVLWDPIGIRLEGEGFGVAGLLLLVGFVAIWLCLVLAGGALHAWGSVTWTRLLAVTEGGPAPRQSQMERRPGS